MAAASKYRAKPQSKVTRSVCEGEHSKRRSIRSVLERSPSQTLRVTSPAQICELARRIDKFVQNFTLTLEITANPS